MHRAGRALVFAPGSMVPGQRAKKGTRRLENHGTQIRLFYLPPYSPERNPDEFLNHDVKANAVGRRRARDRTELVGNVRAYLRSTQKQPDIVKRFFDAEPVKYAA